MPQLDTLRAIAVMLVIMEHWFHGLLPDFINPGLTGVSIFFVLSGFLITRILLKMREDYNQKKYSLKPSLYKFYIRRSLRIFPIYYLVIITCLIFGFSNFQQEWIYYVTYTVNLVQWPFIASHLWTLSVEEQFYTFWPLIVLCVNKKRLVYIILFMIFMSLIYRITDTKYLFGNNDYILIFNHLCTLGVGALFACYYHSNILNMRSVRLKISWFLATCLVTGYALKFLIFNDFTSTKE